MKIVIKLEYKRKSNFSNEKVVLLNTRQVFESAKKAKEELNLKGNIQIIRVCRKIEKSAGKIDGKPLIWVFYKDYINMSEGEINIRLNQSNNKPVKCINTNEIFYYLSDASRKYNVNPTCITRCCKGKQKTTGKHPETGEPLKWIYYK
ncbi:hypothetical protein TPELB_14080 [Terrisporobacter petrolearius]|uniref:Uncharacterized protein n=1 Tax=Terrisporobacter petrolearius TaxID=1460447 RepID=A0ABZ3FBF1_9FIRM